MAFEGIKEHFPSEVKKREDRMIDLIKETDNKKITGGNLEDMIDKWNRISLDLRYLEKNEGKEQIKIIQEKTGITDIKSYIDNLDKKVNVGNKIKEFYNLIHEDENLKFEEEYQNTVLTQEILDELNKELKIKIEGYKQITRNDLNSLKADYEAKNNNSIA